MLEGLWILTDGIQELKCGDGDAWTRPLLAQAFGGDTSEEKGARPDTEASPLNVAAPFKTGRLLLAAPHRGFQDLCFWQRACGYFNRGSHVFTAFCTIVCIYT